VSLLTCLLKKHFPGLVEYRGKIVPATTWKYFDAAWDTTEVSKADIVEQEFCIILLSNAMYILLSY
jgi:hypothetical protein